MCGIFGVIKTSVLTGKDEDFLADAFLANQVRGTHGTGMFTLDDIKDPEVSVVREAVGGLEFLSNNKKDVVSSFRRARVAVGHNRHTTSGNDVDEHCHPFEFDNVVGVHNGGVSDWVLGGIDPDKSHDVDSGRIYAALSEADDPLDVLKEITSGAYALVWYDKRTNKIHMARNGSRPLAVATTSSGVYFASEIGMLTWLMGRNKVTTSKYDVGLLDTYTLYTIPVDDPSKATSTTYETKPAYSAPSGHNITSNYGNSANYKMSPFRKFWSLSEMVLAYPQFEPLKDFIKSCGVAVPDRGYISKYSAMATTYIVDKYGIAQISGYLVAKDGTEINDQVHFAIKGGRKVIEDIAEYIPDPYDKAETREGYPLINIHVDSYAVTPTGEVCCVGRPVYDYVIKDALINLVDSAQLGWMEYVSSEDYLDGCPVTQITNMWEMLDKKAEEMKNKDDIPF